MDDRAALQTAGRLEQMGVVVRSAELRAVQFRFNHFAENGNRELRRRQQRAKRKRGRGVTR